MPSDSSGLVPKRHRLLIQSYCFHPDGTMEERNGWQRALIAAQRFDVSVLYSNVKCTREDFSDRIPRDCSKGRITFVPVQGDCWTRRFETREWLFYRGYRRWQRLAFQKARELHYKDPFQLAHTVTLCGYREPGHLWKLGIPHVWGPIGGTHNFDFRFRACLDWKNAIREFARTQLNRYQLSSCRRVRQAMDASVLTLAATRATAKDVFESCGRELQVDLETGLDYAPLPARSPRGADAPLNILWAGRLRDWKGLPMLLEALSSLRTSVPFSLRVVGDGSSQRRCQRLARQLGINEHIQWLPWTEYRDTLAHYQWADVFAFTSLRDTSGTGLLESMAAGAPIVGLNHQGAADIMHPAASMLIPVDSYQSSVHHFAMAIEMLQRDPAKWHSLSLAATERAHQFVWERRTDGILAAYDQALSKSEI